MNKRIHVRHRPPRELSQPREMQLVLPPMKSNVNLSRIVRAASCCGVTRIVACGNPKVDPKIARDGAELVEIVVRRSMRPALETLKTDGFHLVGLEQTNDSVCIYEYPFVRRTALVIGHERLGIEDDCLAMLDAAVEIPIFGMPYSFNVATATSMALYEFCRQYPAG